MIGVGAPMALVCRRDGVSSICRWGTSSSAARGVRGLVGHRAREQGSGKRVDENTRKKPTDKKTKAEVTRGTEGEARHRR